MQNVKAHPRARRSLKTKNKLIARRVTQLVRIYSYQRGLTGLDDMCE